MGATRVLLAEDEALIALSLADWLEAEGHEVALAADGAEALAAARRMGGALAALVTNLNMPVMGGEDLIPELRSDRPGLPVVVVTGSAPFGGVGGLRRRAGDGPLSLLLKPPDYVGLSAALRRAAAGPDDATRPPETKAVAPQCAARRLPDD